MNQTLKANLAFLIILQYIQPYKNNNDRNLAVLSDIALTLTMLIGLLIKTDTMHSENWNSTVVDVSLVVINGAVSIYAAYTILLPTCLGFWIKYGCLFQVVLLYEQQYLEWFHLLQILF